MESSEYCRAVLQQRMDDGLLHACKIADDVTTLEGIDAARAGAVGVGGGFPCQAQRNVSVCPPVWQGISGAGKGLGLEDARSGLVTHVYRLWLEIGGSACETCHSRVLEAGEPAELHLPGERKGFVV